jgi:hypothetical protein
MRTVVIDAASEDVLKAVQGVQDKAREDGEAMVLTRKSPTKILATFHRRSCSRAFRKKIREIAAEIGEDWPIFQGSDTSEVYIHGLVAQAIREEARSRGAQDVDSVLLKTLSSWLLLIDQNMPEDPEASICEALSTYDLAAILEKALEKHLQERTGWTH